MLSKSTSARCTGHSPAHSCRRIVSENIYRPDSAGPSAVKPKGQQLEFYYGSGEYRTPRTLSEEQIRDIISSFADSAELAVSDATFDGVEIHAANGYLLDQFLTDYTNQRIDGWGGSPENRLAITLEVIRAVRGKIGAEKTLGVRISQGKVNDFHHKWKEGEDGAGKSSVCSPMPAWTISM